MAERRWEFVVRDERARKRRGTVAWCDASPKLEPPQRPAEFAIVVLARAAKVTRAPAATAICVPGIPKVRALRDPAPQHLPGRVEALTMPPQRMAAYAAGRIVTAAPVPVAPADVFPPESDHPRLDRLALALLDIADAEAVAPYTAVIRRGLGLPPGSDPLAELEARLSPPDPRARPPTRAPGIARLSKALRQLEEHRPPDSPLDVIAGDLRFLRLFDGGGHFPRGALDRVLADVLDAPAARRRRAAPAAGRSTKPDAKIVPLRHRASGRRSGDA